MAEDRDYIEEAQHEAQLRFGRELSAEEFAEKFAKHDFEARIYHLKSLRTEGDLSILEAGKRLDYESALRRTHDILSRVGR